MKYLFFLLVTLVCSVQVAAQACGGSIRTVTLTSNGKPLAGTEVKWELFYARPVDVTDDDVEKLAVFVSELAGDQTPRQGSFWFRDVIDIPDHAATKYLESYNDSAFEAVAERFGHEKAGFQGVTQSGKIHFKTGEMDNSPFLLKLTAKGYRDRFVVSAFLGGCYRSGNGNAGGSIEMTGQ